MGEWEMEGAVIQISSQQLLKDVSVFILRSQPAPVTPYKIERHRTGAHLRNISDHAKVRTGTYLSLLMPTDVDAEELLALSFRGFNVEEVRSDEAQEYKEVILSHAMPHLDTTDLI